MTYILGIDVGSGSARCGVFDENATLIGVGKHPIREHRPQTDFVQQSSDDIWQGIRSAVADALATAHINGAEVSALSYSATCSLVLLDKSGQPLALNKTDIPWNIIMWMDHRAGAETEECNTTASEVLKNLGGSMSVEMEIPKLMWIKRNRPELWANLGYAGDLADYLCFRSSGTLQRSICTLGCKWTYDDDAGGWNRPFLDQVGLGDLISAARLPERATPIGADTGHLTRQAAEDLGLPQSCRVGMGLIDAHAGALGTSGLAADGGAKRLALIAGTSNCHIAITPDRVEVPGIWGPYKGAVLDGHYALEGGQSATGAALDQILKMFGRSGADQHTSLAQIYLDRLVQDPEYGSEICVLPDFLGNRSPFADPSLRGAILGLSLEEPSTLLPKLYGATALGIAFGTRQIIEAIRKSGVPIEVVDLSGGHAKSDLLVQLYADAAGCEVVRSGCEEPVLLGAAVAAASALSDATDFRAAAQSQTVMRHWPDPERAARLDTRYRVFTSHYNTQPGKNGALAAAE